MPYLSVIFMQCVCKRRCGAAKAQRLAACLLIRADTNIILLPLIMHILLNNRCFSHWIKKSIKMSFFGLMLAYITQMQNKRSMAPATIASIRILNEA